jgi:dolichyl-phosphate beta-glucosyltransferase
MAKDLTISLIVPCYNEVTNIQKGVLDKIGNFTAQDKRFKEVIIVDDGSSDDSKTIIRERYLKQFPKFSLVENAHLGKAFAIIKGIEEATAEYVMFCDIDLATPMEESEKLITEINNGYDVVIGSRSNDREGAPITRKIMAFGMIFIRHYIIGLKGIKDTQCGFKMFSSTAGKKIIENLEVFKKRTETEGSSVSAGFDLEFLFLASKLGYKIKEVPVIWRHVETKNVTFVKSSLEGLKDIFFIKWYDILKKYPR